ncbi:MAG TPA: hypothetical protein P5137_09545, partial [Candidatus Brocadiia bacterium]|nr:hypothetical protein [Candidatus Brocadiia bacterium]
AAPFQFYAGQAKTHEVFFDFSGDAAAAQQRWRAFEGWPLLFADPAWIAATEALGPFAPRDAKAFPAYENQVEDVYSLYSQSTLASQKAGGALGLMNFGDKGGDGGYNNLETALGEGMMIQFFRSGDRRFLDYADAAIRHFSDIDVDHSQKYAGGIYVHGPHAQPNAPEADFGVNGHSWYVGVRDFYFFTGERRLRDQARWVGEYYLKRPWPMLPPVHYWRRPAWQGMALLCAYEMTGDGRFLTAAGNVVKLTDYQKDTIVTLWPYMFSAGARQVRWYWEKTGDPRARDLYLRIMDGYMALRSAPGDTSFGESPKAPGQIIGNYPAAREMNFYNETAHASRISGDPSYALMGAEDLNIQTRYKLASDVLMWGTADLIGEMARRKIPATRLMATLPWVFNNYDPRMIYQAVEKKDQAFDVCLFLAQNAKYCLDYKGTASLYDPKGRKIAQKPFAAGGLSHVEFKVQPDGLTGVYTLVAETTDFWRWTMDRASFELKPGESVVEFSGELAGRPLYKKAKLDAWVLTDDPLYQPYRGRVTKRPGYAYIEFEAEEGQLSGSMKIGEHPGASGGRYVQDEQGPDGKASATYRVRIPKAGRYWLYARVGFLGQWDRILNVHIDGSEPRLICRTHSMDGRPFPVFSFNSSLGEGSVPPYWHEAGHTGTTYYQRDGLVKGPVE